MLRTTKPERTEQQMEHKMIWVKGHVEVYDSMGQFCFSADNMREAREELRDLAA